MMPRDYDGLTLGPPVYLRVAHWLRDRHRIMRGMAPEPEIPLSWLVQSLGTTLSWERTPSQGNMIIIDLCPSRQRGWSPGLLLVEGGDMPMFSLGNIPGGYSWDGEGRRVIIPLLLRDGRPPYHLLHGLSKSLPDHQYPSVVEMSRWEMRTLRPWEIQGMSAERIERRVEHYRRHLIRALQRRGA